MSVCYFSSCCCGYSSFAPGPLTLMCLLSRGFKNVPEPDLCVGVAMSSISSGFDGTPFKKISECLRAKVTGLIAAL